MKFRYFITIWVALILLSNNTPMYVYGLATLASPYTLKEMYNEFFS